LAAEANGSRFASATWIADIDIVIACGKLAAGMKIPARCAGAGVGAEPKSAVCCVAIAAGVANEGI